MWHGPPYHSSTEYPSTSKERWAIRRTSKTYSLGITALGSLDLDTNTAISKLLGANNLGVQLELETLLGKGAVEGLTV